uniref:Ig-like domain-containing protein n=1 Tax=Catharus ustulatus TaxID=91951 RepID=A0A8C3Y453_CATUS
MHLAHLILTVLLGQLLGKSCLLPKQPFFLFLPLPSGNSQQLEDAQVTVKQGQPFHTTCKYHTSYFTALLWYQVRKGQAPQLVSYQSGTGPRHSGRITTHLNTTGKYSVLKVEEVQVSDSALYLCLSAASVFLPWILL